MVKDEIPTNRYLLEYLKSEFNHSRQKFDVIEKHLDTLNGQVAKNTKFRNKATGIWIGISSAIAAIFTGIIFVINNFF